MRSQISDVHAYTTHSKTYNRLPTDLLYERVDNLANDLKADLRAADLGRVTVHARLPSSTLRSHRWHLPFGA